MKNIKKIVKKLAKIGNKNFKNLLILKHKSLLKLFIIICKKIKEEEQSK